MRENSLCPKIFSEFREGPKIEARKKHPVALCQCATTPQQATFTPVDPQGRNYPEVLSRHLLLTGTLRSQTCCRLMFATMHLTFSKGANQPAISRRHSTCQPHFHNVPSALLRSADPARLLSTSIFIPSGSVHQGLLTRIKPDTRQAAAGPAG